MAALAGYRREPSRTIGVVPKGANHIFWQTVRAGAIKAARENNYEVKWKGSSVVELSPAGPRMPLYANRGRLALTESPPMTAPRYP